MSHLISGILTLTFKTHQNCHVKYLSLIQVITIYIYCTNICCSIAAILSKLNICNASLPEIRKQ